MTSLRKTRLPVGITVSHGNHAWVLTGFTATADPAKTSHFTVTSVRVVGPLWGRQNAPSATTCTRTSKLTRQQFKGFFTPLALRPDPHGLGGQVGLGPAGRWLAISTGTAFP